MGDDLDGFVREFWIDLHDRRALDEMVARLSPDYAMTDHRLLPTFGRSRDDWRELQQSSWELLPDLRCDLGPVTVEGDRAAYTLGFSGTDAVSGGAAEWAFSVVIRVVDGRVQTADIFEDHDAALAFLRGA